MKTPSRLQRAYFTLPEVLLAMALSIALIGSAYQLFHRVWHFCHAATRQNMELQEVARVRNQWRHFVHQLPAAAWRANGVDFNAGTDCARFEENMLVLTRDGVGTSLLLPEGMTGTFAVETDGTPAERVVLNLSWRTRSAGGKEREDHARLVACRPAGTGTATARDDSGATRNGGPKT